MPVFHPYYAIPQRMDVSGPFLAMFILDYHFLPPLPLARNDNAHLFLEVPCRNRRLVPIVNFAIGPSGRSEEHTSELQCNATELRSITSFHRSPWLGTTMLTSFWRSRVGIGAWSQSSTLPSVQAATIEWNGTTPKRLLEASAVVRIVRWCPLIGQLNPAPFTRRPSSLSRTARGACSADRYDRDGIREYSTSLVAFTYVPVPRCPSFTKFSITC